MNHGQWIVPITRIAIQSNRFSRNLKERFLREFRETYAIVSVFCPPVPTTFHGAAKCSRPIV